MKAAKKTIRIIFFCTLALMICNACDMNDFFESKDKIISEIKQLRQEGDHYDIKIKLLRQQINKKVAENKKNISWDDVSKKISQLEKEKENTLLIIKNYTSK